MANNIPNPLPYAPHAGSNTIQEGGGEEVEVPAGPPPNGQLWPRGNS